MSRLFAGNVRVEERSLQVTSLRNDCTTQLFPPLQVQLKQLRKFYVHLSCSSWCVSPGALKWVLTSWKLQPILILMNKSPGKICEATYWWHGNRIADPAASFKHWHKWSVQAFVSFWSAVITHRTNSFSFSMFLLKCSRHQRTSPGS